MATHGNQELVRRFLLEIRSRGWSPEIAKKRTGVPARTIRNWTKRVPTRIAGENLGRVITFLADVDGGKWPVGRQELATDEAAAHPSIEERAAAYDTLAFVFRHIEREGPNAVMERVLYWRANPLRPPETHGESEGGGDSPEEP